MGDAHRDTMKADEENKRITVRHALECAIRDEGMAYWEAISYLDDDVHLGRIVRCLEENWGSFIGPSELGRRRHDHG